MVGRRGREQAYQDEGLDEYNGSYGDYPGIEDEFLPETTYGRIDDRTQGYPLETTHGDGFYAGTEVAPIDYGSSQRSAFADEFEDDKREQGNHFDDEQQFNQAPRSQRVLESIGQNITLRRVKTAVILGAFAVLPNYIHEKAEYKDTPGTFMDFGKLFETPLENIDPLVDFVKKIKNIVA